MADVENLDQQDPSQELEFDLYENLNHEATLASGSVKSYGVIEGGSAIFDKKKSRYTVNAQRLLWLDGYEETTFEGGKPVHQQEMTLVVLKIVFASHSLDKRIGFAKITLMFEDPNGKESQGANEPKIEAWAPFNSQEKWNSSTAHQTKSIAREGAFQLGFSGVEVSTNLSNAREVSWDQTAFDQAYSYTGLSGVTQNPNEVSWVLEQNVLQNQGILPSLMVAVLLSRRSQEPYLVRFHIDTRAGTAEDFRNKTKTFFGLRPDKTRPFLITPWKQEVCNSEGADIRKCIDILNLGRLRDKEECTKLNIRWGAKSRLSMQPQVIGPPTQEVSGIRAAGKEKETNWAEKASSASAVTGPFIGTVDPAPLPFPPQPTAQTAQLNLPPLMIGWCDTTLGNPADVMRVTALEARMAQLEARLATQDAVIFQLQQALAAGNR